MRANLPRYRTEDEETTWRGDPDPLVKAARLLGERQLGEAGIAALRTRTHAEVETAVAAAKVAPEPVLATLEDAVLAPPPDLPPEPEPGAGSAREISSVQAIREAIDGEMEADSSVIVLGEDVGRIGGIFACTRGLIDRYGPERLLDTPISEGAIGNMAVGAAITGLRPIAEVQIFDFVTLMMDAIGRHPKLFTIADARC